jgi:protein associated with RNAse G/E
VTVRMVLRKYDGSPHRRHETRCLGEDEHGTWFGTPAGTVISLGTGDRTFATGQAAVRVVAADRWWSAVFLAEPGDIEVYADVVTPRVWTAVDEVSMVDLDLDVCRHRADGRVRLLDEDEFITNRQAYRYPDIVVARALDAADELWHALAGDVEPFAGRYHHWLDRMLVG